MSQMNSILGLVTFLRKEKTTKYLNCSEKEINQRYFSETYCRYIYLFLQNSSMIKMMKTKVFNKLQVMTNVVISFSTTTLPLYNVKERKWKNTNIFNGYAIGPMTSV